MCTQRRAFTLIELLVVVAIISLLISILLPALGEAREQAKRAKCAAGLHGIGIAVAACENENKGFGPSWDDGEPGGTTGHQQVMYTWVDTLYDLDYLSDPKAGLCPTDKRPDPIAENRAAGTHWNFEFVDNFGVNEQRKRGVRTSFALNYVMHFNFQQDRYKDTARQVYAIDGWWSWFGSLNAAWVMSSRVAGGPFDPYSFPNEWGTMVGWRHGKDFIAQPLYVDGHVAQLKPKRVSTMPNILTDTVDTASSFTWLPGEHGSKPYRDPYIAWPGGVDAYVNQQPAFVKLQSSAKRVAAGENYHPYSYPEQLSAAWRTVNRAWRKLPNEQNLRR